MGVQILVGDVREKLKTLADGSVHCVVTSPPYWGLRDYGVTGQLGMERTLAEHIAVMVDVFREVRRVLRKDGTLWLNYGDCYATSPNGRSAADTKAAGNDDRTFRDKPFSTIGPIHPPTSTDPFRRDTGRRGGGRNHSPELKPKDLCMVPNRLAIALQEDGWWVRSEIIWHKPNGMPESISDRPATAHEKMFLLTKSQRYFYDAEAVLQDCSPNTHARVSQNVEAQAGSLRANGGRKTNGPMKAVTRKPGVTPKSAGEDTNIRAKESWHESTTEILPQRNLRNVWTIPAAAFSDAHFATFPVALVEPCVKAGCPVGGTVLDPFFGAGTTGLVADRLGRNCIGIELNPEYAAMAERRIKGDSPLFTQVAAQ